MPVAIGERRQRAGLFREVCRGGLDLAGAGGGLLARLPDGRALVELRRYSPRLAEYAKRL